jgi:hypothetical protein
MDADAESIDRALEQLERVEAQLADGSLEPIGVTEESGTRWKLDPVVEAVGELSHWWSHYPVINDEAMESLEWLKNQQRGRARRLFTIVSEGLLACGQVEGRDAKTGKPGSARLRLLMDLIDVRGRLQLKHRINRTINAMLVLTIPAVGFLGWVAHSKGTLSQSVTLVLPVLAMIVLLKWLFLSRPIHTLRSRISVLEAEAADVAK